MPMFEDYCFKFRESVGTNKITGDALAVHAPQLYNLYRNFISTFAGNINRILLARFAVLSADSLRFSGAYNHYIRYTAIYIDVFCVR